MAGTQKPDESDMQYILRLLEPFSPKNRWEGGLGDYLINEDGSMDRIVPIPEWIFEEAEKRGIKLKPNHIPPTE